MLSLLDRAFEALCAPRKARLSGPVLLCVENGLIFALARGTEIRDHDDGELLSGPWPDLETTVVGWRFGEPDGIRARAPDPPLPSLRRILAERMPALLAGVPFPERLRAAQARLDIVWEGFGDDEPPADPDRTAARTRVSASCSAEFSEDSGLPSSSPIRAHLDSVVRHNRIDLSDPLRRELADALDSNGTEWRRGLTRLVVSLVERAPKGASSHEAADLLMRVCA